MIACVTKCSRSVLCLPSMLITYGLIACITKLALGGRSHGVVRGWSWHTFSHFVFPLKQDVLHKGLAAQSGHISFIIFFCLLHHAPCSDCISFLSSALFMIFWDLLTTSLFSAVTKTSDQSSSCIEAAVITWTRRGGGNITVWVLWSELLSRCLICPSLVVQLGFQVPRREWRGPFCWAKMHIHTETDR